jgi:hypothetical protein
MLPGHASAPADADIREGIPMRRRAHRRSLTLVLVALLLLSASPRSAALAQPSAAEIALTGVLPTLTPAADQTVVSPTGASLSLTWSTSETGLLPV